MALGKSVLSLELVGSGFYYLRRRARDSRYYRIIAFYSPGPSTTMQDQLYALFPYTIVFANADVYVFRGIKSCLMAYTLFFILLQQI